LESANPFDLTGKRIWVTGHSGMVGAAFLPRLSSEPKFDVVTSSSSELAELIAQIVDWQGEFEFDTSMPDRWFCQNQGLAEGPESRRE
jgi:nucleoside-diphosphate-sugar epimerase